MSDPRDRARPIPQGGGRRDRTPIGRPDATGADDVYVVDTRQRGRRPATSPTADRAEAGPPASTRGGARQRIPVPTPPPPPPQRARVTPAPSARPEARTVAPSRPRQPAGPPGSRGPGAGARPVGPTVPARPRYGARRVALLVLGVLLAWLAFLVWVPVHAWNSVSKVDSTPTADRPAAGKGANYLLVGSDSRAGMSEAEQQELSTGPDEGGGQRTDSIIVVHRSESGMSSMISIPRDSYVEIPGHGRNKINAAFSIGGPQLLVATVEGATGLRIDGFLEIGFGGFAKVVDSLGGVNVCVPFDMNDEKAGINLKAGCQDLNGPNALGYVRARYSDPRGDIGRAERQRQFLAAIVKKAATPSTVLLPWRYYGFATASASGLRVGRDTSLSEAVQVVLTMRDISSGNGVSMVVPIENPGLQTSAGQAVKWDRQKAVALFEALRQDSSLTGPLPGTDGVPTKQ